MVFVSVDTNIWISLKRLGAIADVFRLDYRFLMEKNAARDELLSPVGLLQEVRSLGLVETDLDDEELKFVFHCQARNVYCRLSTYDLFALSIAKKRNILLLTGDGPLRKAAAEEGVPHHGLLWVIAELARNEIISEQRENDLFDAIEQNLNLFHLKKEDVDKARHM